MWALALLFGLWLLKSISTRSLFRRPLLDGALFVFALTAALGYWAAYDETAAWQKFCLVLAAVFFYYAIAEQPAENFNLLAVFWFVVGIGIALYFLLTFDFSAYVVKFQLLHQLGVAWMQVRPNFLQLPSIHPNDAAGIAIIAGVYGFTFLRDSTRVSIRHFFVVIGIAIILFAVVLSSSRGAFMALTGAIGILLLYNVITRINSGWAARFLDLFPTVIVTGIVLIGVIEFLIPMAILGSPFFLAEDVVISRYELMRSGLWILRDFPFTGGGLDSFPGLYSQYVLVIPYYSILNSHNMFLDVAIEQGILGGLSFLLIYLITAWRLLFAMKENRDPGMRWLFYAACISLFTAVFHGLVDDYIYGGRGTILALFPAGMTALISRMGTGGGTLTEPEPRLVAQGFRTPVWKMLAWILPVVLIVIFFWKPIVAQWHANVGAVKMSKLDLAGYPANQWPEGDDIQRWESAENDFVRALSYDAGNQTANHRIGLIRLLARDFEAATQYLQAAYDDDPGNRGIVKNLGYGYLWLGESDTAYSLLTRLPESKYELDVYVWWWDVHGRVDLAKNAFHMAARLGK